MGRRNFGMVAEMTVRFTSAEDLLRKIMLWIHSGISSVEPSWRESLERFSEVEELVESEDPEGPIGPPDAILGRITTTVGHGNYISTDRYRGDLTWRALQAKRDSLKEVFFEVQKLDSRGVWCDGFSLSCAKVGEAQGWLRVSMTFKESEITENPGRFSGRMAVLKSFAESQEINFGHVSYLYSPLFRTAYEDAVNENPESSIERHPDLARGYSWVTVISRDMGESAGGVDAIRTSGVFTDVIEFSSGACWLQAGDSWADFLGMDLSSLYRVFSPILIPGCPIRDDLSGASSHYPPQLVAFDRPAGAN